MSPQMQAALVQAFITVVVGSLLGWYIKRKADSAAADYNSALSEKLEKVKADFVRDLERMRLQERFYSDDLRILLDAQKELMSNTVPLQYDVTGLQDLRDAVKSQNEWRDYYSATLAVYGLVHPLIEDDLAKNVSNVANKCSEVSAELEKFMYQIASQKDWTKLDVINKMAAEVQQRYMEFHGVVSRCNIAQIKRIRSQRAEIAGNIKASGNQPSSPSM